MSDPIVVGIDVGSNKICTLVARLEGENDQRILGVGIEPSQGIKSGAVVDLAAASQSIARSIEKAERTSGLEITSAIVSLAGSQVSGINSRGVVAISGGVISQDDVWRALDGAQAVAIPHNREIVHVIQRGFTVDGQEGIQSPIGFSGYRLEVEAHIITAAAATMENLTPVRSVSRRGRLPIRAQSPRCRRSCAQQDRARHGCLRLRYRRWNHQSGHLHQRRCLAHDGSARWRQSHHPGYCHRHAHQS